MHEMQGKVREGEKKFGTCVFACRHLCVGDTIYGMQKPCNKGDFGGDFLIVRVCVCDIVREVGEVLAYRRPRVKEVRTQENMGAYRVRSVACTLEMNHAVQACVGGSVALGAMRIEFLLGEHVTAVLERVQLWSA